MSSFEQQIRTVTRGRRHDSLRQFKNRLRPDKEIDSEPFSQFKPTKHDHAQVRADIQLDKSFKVLL
jgi:hypothetical protein